MHYSLICDMCRSDISEDILSVVHILNKIRALAVVRTEFELNSDFK